MMEHEGAHVTKPLYSPYNIKIQVINRMLANAKYHSPLLAYGTGEYGAMVSNMPGAHQDEIEKEELSPGEFCIQYGGEKNKWKNGSFADVNQVRQIPRTRVRCASQWFWHVSDSVDLYLCTGFNAKQLMLMILNPVIDALPFGLNSLLGPAVREFAASEALEGVWRLLQSSLPFGMSYWFNMLCGFLK